MSAHRNKLLARLHCVKKERGWSDDEYRDILQARSGARSGADLDDAALARVVAALGGQRPQGAARPVGEWQWANRVDPEKQKMIWKIRRLCEEIGIERGKQVAYAEGTAARVFGYERHIRMMTSGELWKLIGPLERTLAHQ